MADVAEVDCSTGQTTYRPQTQAEITQAQTDATAAQAAAQAASTLAANWQTVVTNIQSRQSQIATWIADNPNGAVLTAAQTLVLAEMLNGTAKILLSLIGAVELNDTSGT